MKKLSNSFRIPEDVLEDFADAWRSLWKLQRTFKKRNSGSTSQKTMTLEINLLELPMCCSGDDVIIKWAFWVTNSSPLGVQMMWGGPNDILELLRWFTSWAKGFDWRLEKVAKTVGLETPKPAQEAKNCKVIQRPLLETPKSQRARGVTIKLRNCAYRVTQKPNIIYQPQTFKL